MCHQGLIIGNNSQFKFLDTVFIGFLGSGNIHSKIIYRSIHQLLGIIGTEKSTLKVCQRPGQVRGHRGHQVQTFNLKDLIDNLRRLLLNLLDSRCLICNVVQFLCDFLFPVEFLLNDLTVSCASNNSVQQGRPPAHWQYV